MKQLKIENDMLDKVINTMQGTEMFSRLDKDVLNQIVSRTELIEYEPEEKMLTAGEPSDSFYIIIDGEVVVMNRNQAGDEIELGKMQSKAVLGDIGLLLDTPRTATVKAGTKTIMLKFDRTIFNTLMEKIPAFGLAISRFLANRVHQLSSKITLPTHGKEDPAPAQEAVAMLPVDFIIRHRVIPLAIQGNIMKIGFVNDPSPKAVSATKNFLPGMELELVRIDAEYFEEFVQSHSGIPGWEKPEKEEILEKVDVKPMDPSSPLTALLKRAVGEGASDIHLTAGHPPRWRIDGEIRTIADVKKLGSTEVYEVLESVVPDRVKNEFNERNDVDFSYSLQNVGRFRVNMYRDSCGISAAFRLIPSKIMTFDQLGLPGQVTKLCSYTKGLVLVTGPTGCGKSTTLASMIHYINETRHAHIITLEDPIEFLHNSTKSLISQREVGNHVEGFARGLRAAFREDPDVILVGELRDLETINLALEAANTGHLVFATLHTSTAVSTVSRVIDVFPPDQQNQVRNTLCDSLRGVIAQNLCKRKGGGRVGVFEILMMNVPLANMVRKENTVQIPSMMQTQKSHGHTILNEELARLVNENKVDAHEALSKAVDREDLSARINMKNRV